LKAALLNYCAQVRGDAKLVYKGEHLVDSDRELVTIRKWVQEINDNVTNPSLVRTNSSWVLQQLDERLGRV